MEETSYLTLQIQYTSIWMSKLTWRISKLIFNKSVNASLKKDNIISNIQAHFCNGSNKFLLCILRIEIVIISLFVLLLQNAKTEILV